MSGFCVRCAVSVPGKEVHCECGAKLWSEIDVCGVRMVSGDGAMFVPPSELFGDDEVDPVEMPRSARAWL